MEDLERKLKVQELEINSLFEISKAINENKPFEEIFQLYEYALKAQLRVKNLALFIQEGGHWKCKVNFGTIKNFKGEAIHPKALEIKEECQIMKNVISPEYNEFQLVAPIKYKKQIIAYLLLGGMYDKGKIAIEMDIPFTRTFTNLIVVALENRRLTEEAIQQEAVKKELDIAKRVQTHLFPEILPDNSIVSVAARNVPHQSVGGDYYDFISVENGFFICVADVSGKGVPAALLMSNFQAAFRILVRQTANLKRIVEELNRLLYENSKGELFVTFFLFKYNSDKHSVEYVNAGHNPGILFYNNMVEELATGTTVLGAFDTLPFINSEEIAVNKFKLILFSDGVSETENSDGKHFGENGIIQVLKKNREKPVSDLCDTIIDELDAFRGAVNYNDDLTLVVCEKL